MVPCFEHDQGRFKASARVYLRQNQDDLDPGWQIAWISMNGRSRPSDGSACPFGYLPKKNLAFLAPQSGQHIWSGNKPLLLRVEINSAQKWQDEACSSSQEANYVPR